MHQPFSGMTVGVSGDKIWTFLWPITSGRSIVPQEEKKKGQQYIIGSCRGLYRVALSVVLRAVGGCQPVCQAVVSHPTPEAEDCSGLVHSRQQDLPAYVRGRALWCLGAFGMFV